MIEEFIYMTALSSDVGFLLARASGMVARAANAALAEYGLRVRHYSVLSAATDEEDGLSQRHLAEILGLDPSQIVLLVDELENEGLVVRRPSPTDRRTRLVGPTEDGRVVLRNAREDVGQAVQGRLNALSEKEQGTLGAMLARVVMADVDGGQAMPNAADE